MPRPAGASVAWSCSTGRRTPAGRQSTSATRVARVVAKMTGKRVGVDAATRMWREADFSQPRRKASRRSTQCVSDDFDQLAELRRIVYGDKPSGQT